MDQVAGMLNACQQGDIATVCAYLDHGIKVDSVQEDDSTALQIAAANGHEQIVRTLLMHGAALDKFNLYRWTPLMQAARNGHTNVVALLLQNKADIQAGSKLNANALTVASRGGHLATVKVLVESGIDLNTSGTGCELTPLMTAAQYGHDAIVRFLLERGSDVNYRMPSTGLNALMLAALNGHMTTAQILIELGCDPNLTNVNKATPLAIATDRGKREVKGYLERKTTNKPCTAAQSNKPDIIEAAKSGDIDTVREILRSDPQQKDASSPADGATPLMFAAMTGRLDIARLLDDASCQIDKQDTISGWTALMQATYHGKKTVAKYLINAGANVSIQAKNGCTAFDMASLIDDVDTELLRLLAVKSVHIHTNTNSSKPPLPRSRSNKHINHLTDRSLDDQPKTGLKAWWNRMSNRFRNLKLGGTFKFGANRLTPLSTNDIPSAVEDKTVTNLNTNILPNSKTSQEENQTNGIETKKNASGLFTLGLNTTSQLSTGETLKAVIPPFLPPPSFDLTHTGRSKMPPGSRKTTGSYDGGSANRQVLKPMKFLQSHSHSGGLASPASPNSSGHFKFGSNQSPGSSGGASGISNIYHRRFSSQTSPSSSVLNKSGGSGSGIHLSDVNIRHHDSIDSVFSSTNKSASSSNERKPNLPSFSSVTSNTTSPNSSTSGSSSLTPRPPSKPKSTSSRSGTSDTLTPSASPTPDRILEEVNSSSRPQEQSIKATEEDDLKGILKILSLEHYQPIFEEQEVDMEAFLTLTDTDLTELGISHTEPRRQILSAITELSSGKDRERQHFYDTMTNFQTTLDERSFQGTIGNHVNMAWNLHVDETENDGPSTKSRSS